MPWERSSHQARQFADWRRVEGLYGQLTAILNDEEGVNQPSDNLTGALAEWLGRTFAHYFDSEELFLQDLLVLLAEIDGREPGPASFRSLYVDNRYERIPAYQSVGDRRRPKPYEGAVETVRRLSDLNRIRDSLAKLSTAGILGGSASYGRFFNTVGAIQEKPSDLDLLLVVPTYDELQNVVAALATVRGVDGTSLEVMARRLHHLTSAQAQAEGPCIISHKLMMWTEGGDDRISPFQLPSRYVVSFHCFSWADFDYATLRDVPMIEDGLVRAIWDFRDTETSRLDNQRSFSGIDSKIDREVVSVEGGFLADSRICHVSKDNRFYPGLHQNLILPQYELRWDSVARHLRLHLLSFRWKLLERLAFERKQRPYEHQTMSLCHTRSQIFAPHIVRRADRD